MILTGKAKDSFKKYYFEKIRGEELTYLPCIGPDDLVQYYPPLIDFNRRPDSMKWGVFVDFFDSEGIYIDIDSAYNKKVNHIEHWGEIMNSSGSYIHNTDDFKTRPEARTKAIEKAVELFNSRES